ncbi:MAG: alpha-galactosidase [Armatimonadota bacterium]|nr:MAG: alpha-galactosidase [Armatimonadota bacterium]
MKRVLLPAIGVAVLAAGPSRGDTPPHFGLNRQTGAVSVVAAGRTILRDARPTIKSAGAVTAAGRLVSVSERSVTVRGLGAGIAKQALYRSELGDVTLSLTQYQGKPYLTAQASFTANRALALEEIRPLDTGAEGALEFARPSGMRILENGHDLWLEEDVRLLGGDTVSNSNWNHALYDVESGKAVVAGFLSHEHAVGLVRTRPAGDWLSWAAASVYDPPKQLAAGERLTGELLYLDFSTGDPFAALEGFAAAQAAVLGIKPWPVEDLQAHWDSWNTRYHTDISLDNMMENARFVAKYLKPYSMRWFAIDDGYQRMLGDWEANERWPGGMKAFADQVHALGLKVAIWIAPFVAHVDSPVMKERPEWALPTLGLIEVPSEWQVLDTSRPDVQRYVEELCRRYTEDWGFDSFNEIDYVYYELLGKEYAVPMTRSEAYRAGLEAIKRGSKPGTFIHGFSILGLGAGVCHGTRTGEDTGPQWQAGARWCWGPKNQAAMSARRYYLNHRVYVLDPDAFYFPHPATVKRWGVPETISLDTTKAWATLVAMTGGMVKVGAAFVDLNPGELAIVRKVLPPSGVSARPLDLFHRQYPRLWQLKAAAQEPWQVLAVFDWDEPRESGPLTLCEEIGLEAGREYVAYDFWGARAFTFRGPLEVHPPRRACTLLAVHPVLGRPQYLSTDRHVTQGAVTLRHERWDAATSTLSGAMEANPNTLQSLVFFVPQTAGGNGRDGQAGHPATVDFAGARVIGAGFAPVARQGAAGNGGTAWTVRLRVTAPEISWRLTFPRSAAAAWSASRRLGK